MSSPEPGQRAPSLQRRLLWRLALGFGLLLGGLFLLLSARIDHAVFQQMDAFLTARAEAFAQQWEEHHGEHDDLVAAYDFAGHTEFFAVYDARDRLRLKSGNSDAGVLALPPSQPRSGHFNARLPDGHAGRAVAQALPGGGWLVLATERESWDRTERQIHLALTGGIALAVLLAVALFLWLVRRAFGPMNAEGERLSALSPQQVAQLQVDHLPRELQPYARAVRDALARSHDALERERRFSRHVAHELRTPVAEVRLATEHALREDTLDALRAGAQTTLQVNARMARGIHALLALSRWENGLESPQPDPLDLAALLRGLARDAAVASERGIDVALPASAWVHSDAGMLERILANLLHNALDYGDADAPVRLSLEADADGYRLRVRNRARGLAPAEVARFGERYWRGSAAGSDHQHAGLGLALARAMADALGVGLALALDGDEVVATLGPLPAL